MGRPPTLPTIAQTCPDLVADWHPTNPKTPDQVSIGAKFNALWKCRNIITYLGQPRACGYEWTNLVVNRARANQGCPACKGKAATDWNSLATLRPDLTDEWDPTNPLTPHEVTTGAGYVAKWVCRICDHHWPAKVDKRVNRAHGCPDCSKRGQATPTNNLAALGDPNLLRDWHPDNAKTPDQYRPHANVQVRWRCGNTIALHGQPRHCRYEWTQSIGVRSKGAGCAACAGKAASDWNNFAVTHPHLVPEWHDENTLQPHEVTRGSKKPVRWQCNNVVDKFGSVETCGWEWNATPVNRTKGTGCPSCSGTVVTPWNNFAARYPDLTSDWGPDNTFKPYQVTPGTDYHAQWRCDHTITLNGIQVVCGHQWRTKPNNRIVGTGCPECMLWGTSRDEIHLAHELARFFTIDNTGKRIPGTTKKWKVDIVLPDLRIIVEYDGSYWHRKKQDLDTRKTIDLTAAGWTVIRVREHPLETLTPNDVTSDTGDHKTTANTVLKQIKNLTGQPIPGLTDYLAQTTLQNGEAAEQRFTELRANVLRNRVNRNAKKTATTVAVGA